MSNQKKGQWTPSPKPQLRAQNTFGEVFKTNRVISLFDCQASRGHSDDLWARHTFLFTRAYYLWGGGGGAGERGESPPFCDLSWPLRSVPGSKFRNENFALMNHKRTSKKKIPQHSQIDVTNYGSGCCPQRVASVVLVKGVFVLVQGVSGLRFWVFVLVTPPLGTQKNLSPRSDSNPRPFVLYRSIFSNLAKAPSTRIRFYLKTDIFSPVWPTVHTYLVKTVT